jgi:methylglutamate dehydrogenase subunit B
MRIPCPFCGLRDVAEFSCHSDAARIRPDPASSDTAAWTDYVYNRANPRGPGSEYWQHNHGCRAFLIVERDTVSHAIIGARLARAENPANDALLARAQKPAKAARIAKGGRA